MIRPSRSTSLQRRLTIGFLAVVALILIVGTVALLSQRFASRSVDQLLAREVMVADLIRQSQEALLQARLNEKEFLLRYQFLGFLESRARYSTMLRMKLAGLHDNMRSVRQLTSDTTTVYRTHQVEATIERYEASFLKMVATCENIGHIRTGIEGQFGVKVHAIEALLCPPHPEHTETDARFEMTARVAGVEDRQRRRGCHWRSCRGLNPAAAGCQ